MKMTSNTKKGQLKIGKSESVNDLCTGPLIRDPALVTSTLSPRGERPLMVSKVTSHDGLNIRDIPVSETVICKQ